MADPGSTDFNALARAVQRLEAESARLRKTAGEIGQVPTDAKGRRELARRVEAETNAGRLKSGTVIQDESAKVERLSGRYKELDRSTQDYGRSLENLRRQGPWAYGRGKTAMADAVRDMERMRAITRGLGNDYDLLNRKQQLLLGPGSSAARQAGSIEQAMAAGTGGNVPTRPGAGGPGAPIITPPNDMAQLNRELTEARANYARLSAAQNASSTAMRRHGALTTEFITAAMRGETTMRELGFQTTATITKFGGWLIAGSAVYAALGAITALGSGAIESASGVNNLQRVVDNVDTSSAQTQMGQLADRFNLPVDQVADAVYQMGKVFHNQEDAFKSAESLLFAVKVGELDVADASRYLIGIINAFNLPASQMASVLDQVNQAQNDFGVSIEGTISGVARAGGAFASAGGEGRKGLSQLLALIATAQKASGVTGEVAGTAIARAPNFLNQESNQAALREFGIDAGRNLSETIRQAMEIAPNLSGARRQDLATAIFGPQYGQRVGIPLLRQVDLYNKILKDTSPENAKGSASQELARALEAPLEKAKALVVGLQELGVQLADAGAFDALFAGLETLNSMLDATTFLLETFNELPAPIRHTVSALTQMMLLLGFLRKFQFGELFAGGPGEKAPTGIRGKANQFFLPGGGSIGRGEDGMGGVLGANRAEAKRVQTALRAQWEDQVRTVEQHDQLAAQAANEEVAARKRAAAIGAQIQIEQAAGADADRLAALKERQVAASEAAAESAKQSVISETRANAARDEQTRMGRALRGMRTRFGGLNPLAALQYAQGEATYGVDTYDKPTTQTPRRLGAAAQAGTMGIPFVTEADRQRLATEGEQLASQMDEGTRNAQQGARGFRANWQRGMNRLSMGLGVVGNLMFAGFIGVMAGELLSSFFEAAGKRVDELQSSPADKQDLNARLEEAKKRMADYADSSWDENLVRDPFGIERAADEAFTENEAKIRQLQARQRRRGDYVPFLFPEQLQDELKELGDFTAGSKQWRDRLSDLQEEMEHARSDSNPGLYKRLKQRIADMLAAAAASGINLKGVVDDLSIPTDSLLSRLDAEMATYAARGARGGGPTRSNARTQWQAYENVVSRLSGSNDPETIQELLQRRDALLENIRETVTSGLEEALEAARTPDERRDALQDALRESRTSTVVPARRTAAEQRTVVRNLVQKLKRRQREQAEALRDLILQGGGAVSNEAGTPTDELGAIWDIDAFGTGRSAVKFPPNASARVKTRIREERRQLRQSTDRLKDARELQAEIDQLVRETAYETNSAIRESRHQARLSRTADPLKQAQSDIRFYGNEIQRAIRVYGRGSQEVMDLISQQNAAIQAQAQAMLDRVRVNVESRFAGKTGEGVDDRRNIASLQAQLSYMQSHAGQFDPNEIKDMANQLADAQAAMTETLQEEAEDAMLGLFEIQQARAEYRGDDVGAIDAQIRAAVRRMRTADTLGDRRSERADLIRLRGQRRDEVVQTRLDDIDFESSIGQMTTREEIRALERMLDTMKISRDMRRDIRRRIYDLRHQDNEAGTDGFALNVSDIKLPTIYDIRRAAKGGIQGQGGYYDNSRNQVVMHIHGGDARKIGKEVAKVMNRGGRAALRSAGMRA